MKVSYNLLQRYFTKKLPPPAKVADLLTFHAFEIESMEEKNGDTILDVKVLPDRAHYALSHRGVARELSFILDEHMDGRNIALPVVLDKPSKILELQIGDSRCLRDSAIVIENIKNGASPKWLSSVLQNLGERSISLIVDATNYVMLDMGQPLHAFDLDKLAKQNGQVKIALKKAKQGQTIALLGGKTATLDDDTLVFVDANNKDALLDIAGVKGGKLAEIDLNTKNIVMFAANFDPSYIRKTATRLGVKSDASKRSENGVPVELTVDGLMRATDIILNESAEAKIEGVVDFYPKKAHEVKVSCSVSEINALLGANLTEEEFEKMILRLHMTFEKKGQELQIAVPYYRKDIKTVEDVAEEVGRIYGYDKIAPVLPKKSAHVMPINVVAYWSEKIKDWLADEGYSEVFTYSLADQGEVEIQNPLAADKNFLRTNLREGIEKSLKDNARNAPLLGLSEIKIFEIGNVFEKDMYEHLSLSFGYCALPSAKMKAGKIKEANWQALENLVKKIQTKIGVEMQGLMESTDSGAIVEFNLTALIDKLPKPKIWDVRSEFSPIAYKPFSQYPFALRDIAVFVPADVSEKKVLEIILKEAGALLVRHDLFDVFEKTFPDGAKKTSYAFRLVFQSFERTLTDEEINAVMKKITDTLNSQPNWQVR